MDDIEKSDLERLGKEILSQPPERALPCNLSDYWLELIVRDLGMVCDSSGDADADLSDYMVAPSALIIHILRGKYESCDDAVEVSYEEMFSYFHQYRVEMCLEEIRRKTDIQSDPATLETIFTVRVAMAWRDASCWRTTH